MKPNTRKILSWMTALAPLSFLLGSVGIIKFWSDAASRLVQEKQLANLPAPTRLLISHAGLASAIPLLMAAAFVASIWSMKLRIKDEADRLSIEMVTHSITWYVALVFFCGVGMAALLPLVIALNH